MLVKRASPTKLIPVFEDDGLALVLVQGALETARQINHRFGTAIILVEQNIKTALGVGDRA